MRKIMLTVVTTCAVVALIPASALAHGHGRHHHRVNHARLHHRTFGHDWNQSGNPTSTSPGADQNAGTVQSFTNGVLTIALNNGQTVSGMVTPDTEIECKAVEPTGMQSHDRNGGDNNAQGDDDQGQGDDDNENAQNCDSSSLTATTMVHEARLRLSGAGATWDKVELVTSSASSSSSSSSDDD